MELEKKERTDKTFEKRLNYLNLFVSEGLYDEIQSYSLRGNRYRPTVRKQRKINIKETVEFCKYRTDDRPFPSLGNIYSPFNNERKEKI